MNTITRLTLSRIGTLLKMSWKFPAEYTLKEAIKIYVGRLLILTGVIIFNVLLLVTFLLVMKAPVISASLLVSILPAAVVIFVRDRSILRAMRKLKKRMSKRRDYIRMCRSIQQQLLKEDAERRQRQKRLEEAYENFAEQYELPEEPYEQYLEVYSKSRSATASSNRAGSTNAQGNTQESQREEESNRDFPVTMDQMASL